MMMRIRIGRLSFEPGLVATAAAAGLIALTLWLGNWQMGRAQEKRERQALLEARMNDNPVVLTAAGPDAGPLLYRRVRAAGRWMGERQFFVDNRIRDGRAGFHVITPLELEPGPGVLLVNRGWIARTAGYPRPPGVGVPSGRVEIAGLATRPPARVLELSPETITGDVWQNLSIERFARVSGLAVLPVVALLDSPPAGLAAVGERPDAGIAKHVEYAFTWFALAATAFALWLVLNFRREDR
jgi:surfeit locus 1 family protein